MTTRSPRHLWLTLLLVGAVALTSACASLGQTLRSFGQQTNAAGLNDINSAENRGDTEQLRRWCDGANPTRDADTKDYACRRLAKIEAPAKALEASCEELQAAYEAAPKRQRSFVEAAMRRFAECGQYEYLFEQVAHWGNRGEGGDILAKMDADGVPVHAELVKYLETHQGRRYFPGEKNTTKYALTNVRRWLVKRGHLDHCDLFVEASREATEWAQLWTLSYFDEAKCGSATRVVSTMLASDDPQARTWACDTLGIIADGSVLKKLDLLAQTDGFSQVREERRDGRIWGVNEYPVRKSCANAANKIRLRM